MARKVKIRVCFQFKYDPWKYKDKMYLIRGARKLTETLIRVVNSKDSVKFSFGHDCNYRRFDIKEDASGYGPFITSGFITIYDSNHYSGHLVFPQFWISNIYMQ